MNKRFMALVSIIGFVFIVSGCTVRSYTIKRDRVDQEVGGNKGFLKGNTAPASKPVKQRQMVIVEVEFGSPFKKQAEKTSPAVQESVAPEGNLGYLTGGPQAQETGAGRALDIDLDKVAPAEKGFTAYEVQKDDTLQKISMQFYGTYKKWPKIYDANKDKIKDPNRIRPGITINIPKE